MRLTLPLLLLLSLLISHNQTALGQPSEYPIKRLMKALSVKEDPKASSFRSVFNELLSLDSLSYCRVTSMLKEQDSKNVRYRIRISILVGQLQMHGKSCPVQPVTDIELLEALRTVYEIDDDWLKFELHNLLSAMYMNAAHFGSAAMHAMTAIDLAEKLGRNNLYVKAGGWYNLGYILYHSREYAASIKASSMALNLPAVDALSQEDTLDVGYRMNALNTIGLCYENLGMHDSAFWAFDQAMTIAQFQQNAFWKGVITGNKGDVYYKLGRYDSAEVMLTYDYHQSLAAGQFDNAGNSLQWLARIELNKGNADTALRMLREAMQHLRRIPHADYKVNALYGYTQVFSRMGKADSMNAYMHQYLTLHDSIEKAANENRLDVVRIRMENQAGVNRVITLSKEKKRITLIRNFSIALIVLLALTGYMILNRQKLKLKLRQQEAQEAKRIAEQDAAQAREQLEVFTNHLMAKTSLVENLQEQLMKRELDEEQILRISELSQHTILTDVDWEKFRSMFEKVYPGFFHALKQQSSDITLAELRMAALCKLQVPSKEAANLLGISPNSVNKTRQRLRSRLGLDVNEDLEVYFAKAMSPTA